MRVCHTMDPVFDDPNLIGFGGLPAVMSLAERAGLHDLVDQHVTVPGSAGANAAVKVAALVAVECRAFLGLVFCWLFRLRIGFDASLVRLRSGFGTRAPSATASDCNVTRSSGQCL